MKNILFYSIWIVVVPVSLFADMPNIDLIFSDDVYEGAVPCRETGADGYCEKAVSIYDSDGKSLDRSEKIQGICIEGGGDCFTVSFALKTKIIENDKVLSLVKTKAGKEAWIIYPKSSFKKVEDWIPKIESNSMVFFRPSLKFVFLDKELTKKIPTSEKFAVPDGIKNKKYWGSIELLHTSTIEQNGQKIIELQINYVEKDPETVSENSNEKATGDSSDTSEVRKRTEIRKIYFPVYDHKGRINYWSQPESC